MKIMTITKRENLHINDYFIAGQAFEVIAIEYSYNFGKHVVTGRNIMTDEEVIFTDNAFAVWNKNFELPTI